MKPITRVLLLSVIIIILVVVWWLATRLRTPDVISCGNLLPPEACNPNWLAGVDPGPPISQSSCASASRLLDPSVGQCTVLTFTDVNRQRFTITVEGADAAVVQEYIGNARAYFIVQQADTGVIPPPDQNLPELSTILVESTGLSKETLRDIRDSIAQQRGPEGEPVTLKDVLIAAAAGELPLITLTPDQVLEAAIERAISDFTTAGVAAGLTQEEIDKLTSTIPDEMTALREEPGATFLDDPETIPHDDAGYTTILNNNHNALAITLDWVTAPTKESANLWVIWSYIDPSIGSYAYHYYKAKCSVYSASARISATAGSMTDYLWRSYPYYYYIGSRTANIQSNPSPGGMWHSSYPARRTYDTYVRGGQSGGSYYIYGGWVQGSGCQ